MGRPLFRRGTKTFLTDLLLSSERVSYPLIWWKIGKNFIEDFMQTRTVITIYEFRIDDYLVHMISNL